MEEVKSRHDNKLHGLRRDAKIQNGILDPNTVITNLSSYNLSDIEKMTLARGLDFTLPPSDIKKRGYLANFEMLFNKLDDDLLVGSNDDKLYLQNKLRDITFSSMYNFKNARKNILHSQRRARRP